MNRRTLGVKWIKTIGGLIVVLGCIHCLAVVAIGPQFLSTMPKENGYVFLYMFIATGLACIAAGLLTVFGSYGLARGEKWAKTTTWGSAVFVCILGAGAIAAMPGNPFSYVFTVLAVGLISPLLLFHRDTRRNNDGE